MGSEVSTVGSLEESNQDWVMLEDGDKVYVTERFNNVYKKDSFDDRLFIRSQ